MSVDSTLDHLPEEDPDSTKVFDSNPHFATDPSADLPSIPGYQLLGILGRGAMGVVFEARHIALNRVVALKMMPNSNVHDPMAAVRFFAEAQVVAAVKHPNVVEVFDFGEAAGQAYLVMEKLSGGTLAKRLMPTISREPRTEVTVIEAIARGVGAAHEQGIVHRDLKPGNVLFASDGTPKVVDFGLAKRTTSDLTATNAIMGTPSYMAPEQATGKGKFVGPPADVWALGVILFECLTGQRPFAATDTMELLTKIADEDPPRLRTLAKGLPRELDVIVGKCLSKEPSERYSTATELADDLRRWLAHIPVVAKPARRWERAYKWARRKPARAAAWVLGLSAVVLGGLATVAFRERVEAVAARQKAEELQNAADRARNEAVARAKKAGALEIRYPDRVHARTFYHSGYVVEGQPIVICFAIYLPNEGKYRLKVATSKLPSDGSYPPNEQVHFEFPFDPADAGKEFVCAVTLSRGNVYGSAINWNLRVSLGSFAGFSVPLPREDTRDWYVQPPQTIVPKNDVRPPDEDRPGYRWGNRAEVLGVTETIYPQTSGERLPLYRWTKFKVDAQNGDKIPEPHVPGVMMWIEPDKTK